MIFGLDKLENHVDTVSIHLKGQAHSVNIATYVESAAV